MCKISIRKRSSHSESDLYSPTRYDNETCVATKRVNRSNSHPNTKVEFNAIIAHLTIKEYVGNAKQIAERPTTTTRHEHDVKIKVDPWQIPSSESIRTILTIIYVMVKRLGYEWTRSKPLNKLHNFSKTKNYITTKYNQRKNSSLDFLFQLQRRPLQKLTTCPVSLNTYFESLTSGTTMSEDESMSNDLLRISSYSNFPRNVNIFTSLLSKAGFYYTGHTDEVRCYACGLSYKNWKSGDIPLEIHKRMSPSCFHVTNLNLSNGNLNRNDQSHPNNFASCSVSTNSSTNTRLSCSLENRHNTHLDVNGSTGSTQHLQGSLHNGIDTTHQNGASGFQDNHDMIGDLQSSLGIEVNKPKYPNYAPLPVRISSFEGWPSDLDQTAHEMASAGFLYAGYQDYTRCFFCGGGLRNWEAGDDPWIEHARWFPKCTFLKQNKGDRFIRAVQQKQEQLEKETNTAVQSPTLSQNAAQSPPTLSQNPNPTNTDQPIKLLDSVAAKSVMEMGYTNEDVLKAIQKLMASCSDVNEITATNIMTILLNDDDESHRNRDVASATSTTSTIESPNVSNGSLNKSPEAASVDMLNSMLNDVDELVEENRHLKDLRLCKVCLDMDASIAFLPCGHIVCCTDCAPAMRKCPMCRTHVKGTVKTFLV